MAVVLLFPVGEVQAQKGSDLVTGTGIATAAGTPWTKEFSDAWAELTDRVVVPVGKFMVDQAVLSVVEFALNKIAYDTAVALVSAGKGETPLLFTEPDRYFEAVGRRGHVLF